MLVERASGLLLAEGARFNEAISRLAPATFVPKGVYRFRSHACFWLRSQATPAARLGSPHWASRLQGGACISPSRCASTGLESG